MQPDETQDPISETLQAIVKTSKKQIQQALILPADLQLQDGTPGDYVDCSNIWIWCLC